MNGKPKKFLVKSIDRKAGLVRDHITIVDQEDAHYLRNSYWVAKRCRGEHGAISVYIVRNRDGLEEKLHELISGAKHGERVSHVNGDSLDNRKANLLKQSARCTEIE